MKMFLDDTRNPYSDDFDVIINDYNDAVKHVLKYGVPSFISFDHDLGSIDGVICKTGYDFAKWLVNADLDGIVTIPSTFRFHVHSANPVGAANIQNYLDNYLQQKYG